MMDTEGLARKGLSALKWSYVGTAVRMTAQIFAQIIIARIIGPENSGLFFFAMIYNGITTLFVDQGLTWALVRQAQATHEEIRIALWRCIWMAVAISALTITFRTEVATLLGEPRSAGVIALFSVALVIAAMSVPSVAALRRDLDFKTIQTVQTLSYVLAYPVAGVLLAYLGFGAYSLVIAWILQSLICAVGWYAKVRHPLAPINPFRRLLATKMGAQVSMINIVNWMSDNLPSALVGKLLGAYSLGLYNTSAALVKAPAVHIVTNLQMVLFPIATKISHEDVERSGKLYVYVLSTVSFILVAGFGFVAAAAHPIVAALLGSKWTGAAEVLAPLALAMAATCITNVTGSMLTGSGKQVQELKGQMGALVLLVLFVGGWMLWAPRSLASLSWLIFAWSVVRCLLLASIATHYFKLPRKKTIYMPLQLSMIAVMAALASKGAERFLTLNSALVIGILALVYMGVVLVCTRVLHKVMVPGEFLLFIDEIQRLPNGRLVKTMSALMFGRRGNA